MPHAHGSGRACWHLRSPVKCDECKAYERLRHLREAATPGTHRYNATHGIAGAGQSQQDRDRYWRRKQRNATDAAKLAELMGGK